MERQAEAQSGSVVLREQDVSALENMCGDTSGYFYRMLDYLDQRIRDGVRLGTFTEEQARADLDLALWYSYACNNIGDYDYYYKAAQWMPASERAAEAAKSGVWYYRYACALMYCGRLEEARHYAEAGVALDPDYPWGWLEAGKLRAHFGDRAGALEAADRGLALVPGDYEFTTLRREIREGRTLEEMEFHWIDPACDALLQAGEDESEPEKRMSIAGICCDQNNLEAIKAALAPTAWEADAPYCTFQIPYQGGSLTGRFFLNEAALSKVPLPWVQELVRRLPELDRRGRTFLAAQAGLGTEGLSLEWFAVLPDRTMRLSYVRGQDQQLVLFDPDFSLSKEDQPALAKSEGGAFLAFVLLETPAWDPDQFRRDLRDLYGIPCLTEMEERDDGGSVLTFEVSGMVAAVSLYPSPVPHGEAEENAAHNYMWQSAAETAARHQGQLLVTVLPRERDHREAAALQVKLVCAACCQSGVLGVYANGTVYQPEFYLNCAKPLEDGQLPLPDLVWIGLYRRESGLCGYTDGLRSFGKDEIEVLDAQAEPGDLHSFLLDLVSYVLDEDVTLHDGETIGYTEDQYLPVSRSAGVWHGGMTLKIPYPDEP